MLFMVCCCGKMHIPLLVHGQVPVPPVTLHLLDGHKIKQFERVDPKLYNWMKKIYLQGTFTFEVNV